MRRPAVADQFYPGNREELEQTLDNLLPRERSPQKALAVVCPHAGYIYSGALAAKTLSKVEIPPTVMLLGPNHHGLGPTVSLSTKTWQMAQGNISVNQRVVTLLQKNCPLVDLDESGHLHEHCIEVQLPFLQRLQPKLTIVPLVLSRLSYPDCINLAKGLVQSIQESGQEVLLLASTDMNHYESRQQGGAKDQLALDQLKQFDAKGLYDTVISHRISMCGFIAVVICMLASRGLGGERVEIVGHTDSGELTGDTFQVVGYAGAIIS